jgi:hypothetical protein
MEFMPIIRTPSRPATMPILSELSSPAEWVDPDLVPRPVMTIGATGVVMDSLSEQESSFHRHHKEMDFHRHRKGELLLALRGVLTCEVEGGFWIVPPQSAIWVPGGVLHKFTVAGTIECYVVFIDPNVASNLPSNCCALSTTPLLRELMIRSASLPMLYAEGDMDSHLVTLLLDEIAVAPLGNLHLPMPAPQDCRDDHGGPRRLRHDADVGAARGVERTHAGTSSHPGDGHELRPLASATSPHACSEMAGNRVFGPAGRGPTRL